MTPHLLPNFSIFNPNISRCRQKANDRAPPNNPVCNQFVCVRVSDVTGKEQPQETALGVGLWWLPRMSPETDVSEYPNTSGLTWSHPWLHHGLD